MKIRSFILILAVLLGLSLFGCGGGGGGHSHVSATPEDTLSADFTVDPSSGTVGTIFHFKDLSTGTRAISKWEWDFGDGSTSTDQNPTHQFGSVKNYQISLTITDANGKVAKKTDFIDISPLSEDIFVCDAYDGSGTSETWSLCETELANLNAQKVSNGVWTYTNTEKGVAYTIRRITTASGMEDALKAEGAHIIFNGHANYGLGATFTYTQGDRNLVRYVDDDLIVKFSTDMVGVSLSGMQENVPDDLGYTNWLPKYKDSTSAVMPFNFGDPSGNPPYNYYLTYKIPGDSTLYFVEKADGSRVERFPGSSEPWDWRNGEGVAPDAAIAAEQKFFITNPSADYHYIDALYGPIVILKAKDTISDADLNYRRMFYSACFSGPYFLGRFNHGQVFSTFQRTSWENTIPGYLSRYLQGDTDQEIITWLKDENKPYEYFNFDLKPPTKR